MNLEQAVTTLGIVKYSRRIGDAEGFEPTRKKPKAFQSDKRWRRQFYGLAYRWRTGTLFPPALFSLSLPHLLSLVVFTLSMTSILFYIILLLTRRSFFVLYARSRLVCLMV